MARKLSAREASKAEKQMATQTVGTTKARYPWDKWTDGDVWELTYGEAGTEADFSVDPKVFRVQLHQVAKRRGMKVSALRTSKGLLVKFTRPDMPEPATEPTSPEGTEPDGVDMPQELDNQAPVEVEQVEPEAEQA
jgi:hypothetical protein